MNLEARKSQAVAFMTDFAVTSAVDLSRFTQDATWWTLNGGELAIHAYAQRLAAISASQFAGPGRFVIERVTAEGERVAVEARGFQPLKGGRSYDNLYLWLVCFRGDKICEVKAYFDTALAGRIFASPQAS